MELKYCMVGTFVLLMLLANGSASDDDEDCNKRKSSDLEGSSEMDGGIEMSTLSTICTYHIIIIIITVIYIGS